MFFEISEREIIVIFVFRFLYFNFEFCKIEVHPVNISTFIWTNVIPL